MTILIVGDNVRVRWMMARSCSPNTHNRREDLGFSQAEPNALAHDHGQ
jgi:hypothetical protein